MKTTMKICVSTALITALTTLSGCGEKTGALPEMDTVSYAAPTSAEARTAYLGGFDGRYKVPVLNYSPEIIAQVKSARIQRLKTDKRRFKANMMAARMVVNSSKFKELSGNDKQYADIIRGFGKAGEIDPKQYAALDAGVWEFIALGGQTTKKKTPRELKMEARKYDQKVRAYKGTVGKYEVIECHWKKMQVLIGSGYEDMAIVHGIRPSHGYRCKTERTYKTSTSIADGTGFFIKNQAGEWIYFGKYGGVGVKTRRLKLNQMLLDNPEKTLKKLSPFDIDI